MNQNHNNENNTITNGDIELSIVIPCFNEEEVLPISIPPLIKSCQESIQRFEIILVNNGSHDSTPEVIDSFITQGHPVQRVDVAVNEGFGWGIICGIKVAKGKYIGYLGADGQITPKDVIKTWQAIRDTQRGIIAKGQRINRADGILRKSFSGVFNLLFYFLYGSISKDVNGTPKFFHRNDMQILNPVSKDSFIDPELLIKAKALKYNIIEVPVIFQPREGGTSSVRIFSKSFEFLKDMIQFRFGKEMKHWLSNMNINK